MSLTVKVEPIDRDVALMLDEALGPEARSKALASFARTQLVEAETINRQALGVVPDHQTFVDGRKGAMEETVKPEGTIVYEFDLVADALDWIGAELVRESPVRTGRYAKSHILLADGVEVEKASDAPGARTFVFMNVQPYARKIERGLSPQAPDGVYQAIAAVAKGKFGNVAKIRFSYQSTIVVAPGASRAEKRAATDARQPAIVVTMYGG